MFDYGDGGVGAWITTELDEGAVLAGLSSIEECSRLLALAGVADWRGPGAQGFEARRVGVAGQADAIRRDLEDLYVLASTRNELSKSAQGVP